MTTEVIAMMKKILFLFDSRIENKVCMRKCENESTFSGRMQKKKKNRRKPKNVFLTSKSSMLICDVWHIE